jgi:hypothetical protein
MIDDQHYFGSHPGIPDPTREHAHSGEVELTIKFSPNNRRPAVASFLRNKIAIFEICIAASPYGRRISISDVAETSSSYLKESMELILSMTRKLLSRIERGDVTIFNLPSGGGSHELVPLEIVRTGGVLKPGAVYVQEMKHVSPETLDAYESIAKSKEYWK